MEKELQGKLVEILTSIQNATGKAADFAMDQLPDIAQSYIAYGRAAETLTFICVGSVFAASLYAFLKCGLLNKSGIVESGYEKGCWTMARQSAAVLGGMASAFTGLLTLACARDAAFVWFAPKVWLLKELSQLVK